MLGIKIVWMIANTVIGAWFNFTVLRNPILYTTTHKWSNSITNIMSFTDRISFALLIALEVFHFAIAIAVCLLISVSTAVVTTSLILFGWALVSYFLLQRFEDKFDRPIRIHNHPMFHPLMAFVSFVLSIFTIIFFANWRWVLSPVVIWLVIGFICAEVAIQRYIRRLKRIGEECDRGLAIFAVNNTQGRCDFMNLMKNRYPFP